MIDIAGGILIAVGILAALLWAARTIREGTAEKNNILRIGGWVALGLVIIFAASIFMR
jgi:uncharacterized membrane protein